MIRSFLDKDTRRIFHRKRSKKLDPTIATRALRKLLILDAAEALRDLRSPPGNRLEKLKGDREGQFSIRIDRQWRICFRWHEGHVHDVEIVDYH